MALSLPLPLNPHGMDSVWPSWANQFGGRGKGWGPMCTRFLLWFREGDCEVHQPSGHPSSQNLVPLNVARGELAREKDGQWWQWSSGSEWPRADSTISLDGRLGLPPLTDLWTVWISSDMGWRRSSWGLISLSLALKALPTFDVTWRETGPISGQTGTCEIKKILRLRGPSRASLE